MSLLLLQQNKQKQRSFRKMSKTNMLKGIKCNHCGLNNVIRERIDILHVIKQCKYEGCDNYNTKVVIHEVLI